MKLIFTFFMLFLLQRWQAFEDKHTFPDNCEVNGTTKIDATVLFVPYKKEFNTAYSLKIQINQSSKQVLLDITHKGHTSTLNGSLVNDNFIELLPNQSIPQNFAGEGFEAALTGDLKKGTLTMTKKQIRMYLSFDVNGTIKSDRFSADAKGKIETDVYSK